MHRSRRAAAFLVRGEINLTAGETTLTRDGDTLVNLHHLLPSSSTHPMLPQPVELTHFCGDFFLAF